MRTQRFTVTFGYRVTVEAESMFEAVQNATMQLQCETADDIKMLLTAIDVTPAGEDEDEDEEGR